VKTFSHEELSVQQLFQQSSVMITDYSSVAFEMALLERAVVYFQFDHTSFFTGDHAFQQGYFNFEKDGFGPVCTTHESLVDTLQDILRRDAIPSEAYMERIHRFFRYHDTNNSKRVFQAVRSMEEPRV
jgi:CDP-glycerol glycerophosphotransferase (TagB/SpsB family)